MVSGRHDINAIQYWLQEIIKDGAPIPKQTICDFSLALLGAIAKAFAKFDSLHGYLNSCSKIITGPNNKISATINDNNIITDPNHHLPDTVIRVDISHVIKIFCRWECLRKWIKCNCL